MYSKYRQFALSMKVMLAGACFILAPSRAEASQATLTSFFSKLKQLKFEDARVVAEAELDTALRAVLVAHTDLLWYSGQKDGRYFKSFASPSIPEGDNTVISIVRLLNAGYYSLYYDRLKGTAYKNFYDAYQIASELNEPVLTKACIFALLKYYGFEIAQNSDFHQPYLDHLERVQEDVYDSLWHTLYNVIFWSKELERDQEQYLKACDGLDHFEKSIDPASPLLAYVYYEKALKHYFLRDLKTATDYYLRTVEKSAQYPFLNTERFLALIKLSMIATEEKNFKTAKEYLSQARLNVNKADTLRSDYYLNLYGATLLNAENKNDSAYALLMKAYLQDFQLDFRRNTLEVNRLIVELETREKENANLRLREGRIWLLLALVGTALVAVTAYLAYTFQRAKNIRQSREAEIKVENLMKEQELVGINSMLEGQEKERKRIANELHDDLGSLIATLKLHLHALQGNSIKDDAHSMQLMAKADQLINETYEKVRAIAHMRNAGVSAQEGLLPAVRNFASKVSIVNSLSIEVNEHGIEGPLENSLEITVFRIIQELIANIIKHARATNAIIHLTQHQETINIMVEDNGVGFDVAQIKPSNGMGLHSIQRRVETIGGSVTIESIPNNGTTVIIDLPIS